MSSTVRLRPSTSPLSHWRSNAKGTKRGLAWTSWPLRGSKVDVYASSSWTSLVDTYGEKEVEGDNAWFESMWRLLEEAWFSRTARPRPTLVLVDGIDEAIDFAKSRCLGLVLVKAGVISKDAADFFHDHPSATVFHTYSKDRDQTSFVLRDGLLVEPLANLQPTDGLILVQRLCPPHPNSMPVPLALALDAIWKGVPSKRARVCFQEPPLAARPSSSSGWRPHTQKQNRFETHFHLWRQMRNHNESCTSCTRWFCPHRSFPYYVTPHPDSPPRRFRCPECQNHLAAGRGSFQRSTRLTDRAAEELVKRCLGVECVATTN